MTRGDYRASGSSHAKEGVGYGGHTRTEGHNVFGTGQRLHLAFEIRDGGVRHAGIVRHIGTSAERLYHFSGIIEFKCGTMIHRHT